MPVTVKVNGVANSLVHKGSNGVSVATMPDVCKTPSPGGPVPIPYPNISQSITLAKGTTTVKADGGMMIANKGSEFSLSNGDNAGVAGGVKSSTFMKESTWILYSFDVKMDGKGACRLSDKKFQNHENTADLAGLQGQNPVAVGPPPECIEAAAAIDKVMNGNANYKSIKQRAGELKANPQNQPMFWGDVNPGIPRPPGSDQFGHLIQIEQQQTELANALQSYFSNGCSNADPHLVADAAVWVTRDPISML